MLQDAKILGKVSRLERTYQALRFVAFADLSMEFAETREHFRVPPGDAELNWKPVAKGHGWGESFSTGWFRGSVKLPLEVAGNPVYIRASPGGPETMFLVDGQAAGVFDVNHPVRLLCLSGEAGHEYSIHLESYAGHTFPGTQPFDDVRSADGEVAVTPGCRIFESVELVSERPEVGEFVATIRALRQTALGLDEHSLRRAKIIAGLGKVFELVPQKPEEFEVNEWREALRAAITSVRPLLDSHNGPTTPFMGVVGHSHIDTAWLWPVAETWRKCARTFSSVLSLMDQYPEFCFTSSAALHMDKMRELYPDLFSRIQNRVKEGRWEINGAMWIEPDCNIPSGESFVRQCLFGQRATQEMFGVVSDTLWQPDVFGYSAALPQILQKSRVKFFCTTKLSWNDTNRFPYDTFHWQGIDGSRVLAHFNEMQGWPYPENLIKLWNAVQHPDVQDRRLVGFGHGDGGGGPMMEMIESLRVTQDLEGCPKTEYATIGGFMTGCLNELTELPTWVGELYLELHRGTLTSIAGIKRGNRKCEFALRDAEFWATLASHQTKAGYPQAKLSEAWKKLLLNQFHDILPGSSIQEVNDEAMLTFAACHEEAAGVQSDAIAAIFGSPGSRAVVIGNSLSWEREGEITLAGLPDGVGPVGAGKVVSQPFQSVAGENRLAVSGLSIPALGYVALDLAPLTTGDPSPFQVDGDSVTTPWAKVRIDELGRIVSFFDSQARRELVSEGGCFNHFLLGEDVPAAWDNWDIDRDQRHQMQPIDTPVERETVSDGPLQLRIRFRRKFGHASSLVQDVVFHAASPQVDFETVVEWHEKYQFLKTEFDLDVLAETALHEIQFGHVQRNSHDNTSQDRAQFDVCAHKWTDISEGEFGVAFLNDCKYACTVKGRQYMLSLLKSGRHPDARGDEGRHAFTYALLPHQGGFSVKSVVRPAYELNLVPSVSLIGGEASSFSFAEVDVPNVIVAALKQAEDGAGIILRAYEAGKTGVHARILLSVPVEKVIETNLLEEELGPIPTDGNAIDVYFKPFEIKTFRIVLSGR